MKWGEGGVVDYKPQRHLPLGKPTLPVRCGTNPGVARFRLGRAGPLLQTAQL